MHADAWFVRGGGHAVGQDYARAGNTADGAPFVALADGCSSAPDTDCGARLLVLAAAQMLAAGVDPATVGPAAVKRVAAARLAPTAALDATLLLAVTREHHVQIAAFGDGVIFAVDHAGAVTTWPVDHGDWPAYPAYLLDDRRLAAYQAQCERDPAEPFRLSLPIADWRMVGVASDGLAAFTGPDGRVPLHAIVAELADVRVPSGAFMQRAANFFLRRTCPKRGWTPGDDCSVGALWLS